jgi:putative transposase
LAKETKRSSSIWIKEKDGRLKKFAWQAGYGAFSIGQSQIEEVKHYITNQAVHHQRLSFRVQLKVRGKRMNT